MGNENIKLGSGTLFIRSVELCEVGAFPVDKKYVKILRFHDIQEATFSGTCTTNNILFLRITKSNNWLRLHGYPMRRKVWIKRYGKKN